MQLIHRYKRPMISQEGTDVSRDYILLSAPDNVSLLTTNAWMFGSQLVGPYTSVIGTISYTSPGRNRVRNARTLSLRTESGSSTSRNALDTSSVSSMYARYAYAGVSNVVSAMRTGERVPVTPTMSFWCAIQAPMLSRILCPACRWSNVPPRIATGKNGGKGVSR